MKKLLKIALLFCFVSGQLIYSAEVGEQSPAQTIEAQQHMIRQLAAVIAAQNMAGFAMQATIYRLEGLLHALRDLSNQQEQLINAQQDLLSRERVYHENQPIPRPQPASSSILPHQEKTKSIAQNNRRRNIAFGIGITAGALSGAAGMYWWLTRKSQPRPVLQ